MLAVVALNMGGPDSPAAVEPFLRNLFADPDIIQLGWARPVQPLLARLIARRRAPLSRAAYAQIGGRSPIREESMAQVQTVVAAMAAAGVVAKPYLAMSYWHPFPAETAAAMRADGIDRALLLPLYPHRSRTTTGSAFRTIESALAGIATARIEGYATAPGYIEALCDRISEASGQLPDLERATAPVLFSAHGLPESYIRRGDPYLDQVRATVAAVAQRLALESRSQLAFQSRVGRQRWLAPTTEEALDALAAAGQRAAIVVPVSFTGEHLETLQEIDILYRERAATRGIASFARAQTVGCHPAFIAELAALLISAARARGWV
ncbi:MAG TPA: ferrochelatase [Polyangia bacterium]|nr:ferrochelatase [Polyangia bacterium]